jgi:PEGA domain-containing protein
VTATTRAASPRSDRARTGERAVPNATRPRGDRPSYGTAVARTHPPYYPGGGGGYHPSYPWYAPWYPYSFGLFYWDPLWWGATYSPYGVYDSGYGYDYGGGPSSAGYGTGSLKLKVKPNDAQVYVDGYFAGLVDDFDGVFQKLNLEVGPHHIEIHAPGYETLSFDVQIQFDETTTYRGELTKGVR